MAVDKIIHRENVEEKKTPTVEEGHGRRAKEKVWKGSVSEVRKKKTKQWSEMWGKSREDVLGGVECPEG